MQEIVRTLHKLIGEHGNSLLDDPRRLRALLLDLCGEQRREINLLTISLHTYVPQQLRRTLSAEGTTSTLAAALIHRLQEEMGLTESAATWTVETWTTALQLSSKREPVTREAPPHKKQRGTQTESTEDVLKSQTTYNVLSPASSPKRVPNLLSGRYRIGEWLGYGGISSVYRAYDKRLHRNVAVKFIQRGIANDSTVQNILFKNSLLAEAQKATQVQFEPIVDVYDYGMSDIHSNKFPYIVMEYIDGRTLGDVVRAEGALPEDRARPIIYTVCAALGHLHSKGIIHCDVSLGNIMITPEDDVKVMDFCIGRALLEAGLNENRSKLRGTITGTAHLSAEQLRGGPPEISWDIYWVGCVLLELLDDKIGASPRELRRASTFGRYGTPGLRDVANKACAERLTDRYESFRSMRIDLLRG
jgi:serine/threonine protein kinase